MNPLPELSPFSAALVSPKQPALPTHRDWYPYYAGFTERFAASALERHLQGVPSVVDPWSGSGTTSLACARLGIPSTGSDLNPALTVIARARLAPRSCSSLTAERADRIVTLAQSAATTMERSDPLARWIRTPAVLRLRSLQNAIASCCGESPASDSHFTSLETMPQLSECSCFYYTVLFATVRDLLSQFTTTNPMWIKTPRTFRHRLAPSWKTIRETFLHRFSYFRSRLDDADVSPTTLSTGPSSPLPFPDGYFGGALTSPPYATRIDYVVGMLPELSVLKCKLAEIRSLRAAMVGTPAISQSAVSRDHVTVYSDYGRQLTAAIFQHRSKGSRSYYGPWLRNYFLGLQLGVTRTRASGDSRRTDLYRCAG